MLKKVLDNFFLAPPIFDAPGLIPLRDAGITHIINAAAYDNSKVLTEGGFEFQILPFIDSGKEQPPFVWEQAKLFIEKAWEKSEQFPEGGKVAVHCIGGPRRSATIAYLALRLKELTDMEARKFLEVALPGENPLYACHVSDWLELRKTMIFSDGGSG